MWFCSMKQSIQDAEQLMEEMDAIRGALAENETASSSLKACISKLVRFALIKLGNKFISC